MVSRRQASPADDFFAPGHSFMLTIIFPLTDTAQHCKTDNYSKRVQIFNTDTFITNKSWYHMLNIKSTDFFRSDNQWMLSHVFLNSGQQKRLPCTIINMYLYI